MKKGFSHDGYIIDQNCFSDYPYRAMSSDINGCGWIAAFNLLRALGIEADFDAVRAEMDSMYSLRLPGPTTMRVMREYLERHVPGLVHSRGLESAILSAAASRAGILRYWESEVPHFVAFLRREDGMYRFFNVADGLEDHAAPMEEFMRSRCVKGSVHAITAP